MIEEDLGRVFTIDACANAQNNICDTFYTAERSFMFASLDDKDLMELNPPNKQAIWCNPPFTPLSAATPIVMHLIDQIRKHPGALAAVLFPDWTAAQAYKVLRHHHAGKTIKELRRTSRSLRLG